MMENSIRINYAFFLCVPCVCLHSFCFCYSFCYSTVANRDAEKVIVSFAVMVCKLLKDVQRTDLKIFSMQTKNDIYKS